VPNCIIISKSNITSLNESIDYTALQLLYTSNANANTNEAEILLQNNILACSNQENELRNDGFSWYSHENISENEQQEIEKKPSGKL
jgi:hypothetical protein